VDDQRVEHVHRPKGAPFRHSLTSRISPALTPDPPAQAGSLAGDTGWNTRS